MIKEKKGRKLHSVQQDPSDIFLLFLFSTSLLQHEWLVPAGNQVGGPAIYWAELNTSQVFYYFILTYSNVTACLLPQFTNEQTDDGERRAHDSLNSPSTIHFLAPSLSLHYLDNRAVSLTSGICYGTVSEKLQSLVVASLFFILFTYAWH